VYADFVSLTYLFCFYDVINDVITVDLCYLLVSLVLTLLHFAQGHLSLSADGANAIHREHFFVGGSDGVVFKDLNFTIVAIRALVTQM